jgi:RHS repeat-associated protein
MTDESGSQVKYLEYQPYGETKVEKGSLAVKRKFTGKELDDSTGLYDYGARQYEAKIARFISPDTVDPKLTNPQTLNRYSYTLNNPLKYIDPTGQAPVDYAYDPILLAMSWDVYQVNPSLLNAIAFGVDLVLTATPYVPALGGVTLRGIGKFLSKSDDMTKAAKVVDKAGEVGKAVAKGEGVIKQTIKTKKIVIGESMDRVIPKAKELGVEYYKPRQRKAVYTLKEKIEKNVRWIKGKIKQGYSIEDMGIDPNRPVNKRSPFYKAEKEAVKDAIKKGTLRDYEKIK